VVPPAPSPAPAGPSATVAQPAQPAPVPTQPAPLPAAKPEAPAAEPQLADVPGIGKSYSARLNENGITKVSELAALTPTQLSKMIGVSQDKAAELIQNAQHLLSP